MTTLSELAEWYRDGVRDLLARRTAGMSDDEEAETAEQLVALGALLSAEDQAELEKWLESQKAQLDPAEGAVLHLASLTAIGFGDSQVESRDRLLQLGLIEKVTENTYRATAWGAEWIARSWGEERKRQ